MAPVQRPISQPIGFLSDIHGNLAALEAVLAELAQRAVVDLCVAGDHLLGGGEPVEVWQRLQQLGTRCTQGPSDLALASIAPGSLPPGQDADRAAAFERTHAAIGELIRRQLSELPTQLRLPMIDGRELLLVHGSPADALTSMSEDMSDEELDALIGDDPADIVICGGSHVPFQRRIGEVEIYNVGSVGQAPEGRYAHYLVVSPKVNGADVYQGYAEY